jgi:hypothetical protein
MEQQKSLKIKRELDSEIKILIIIEDCWWSSGTDLNGNIKAV